LHRVGLGRAAVDVGERLAVCVADDVTAGDLLGFPRRREMAGHFPESIVGEAMGRWSIRRCDTSRGHVAPEAIEPRDNQLAAVVM
jgi:hypothetical protein